MKIVFMCFFCTLAHIPSLILRYIPFKSEVSKKQRRIIFSIYALALLANALMYYLFYRNGKITIAFYKYNLLLFCILMAIVNGIIIKKRVREHFFTFGLTAIIVFMIMTVSTFIESKLVLGNTLTQITINSAVLCIIFALLYPFLKRLMVGTITPFLNYESRGYWNNIWFIPVAMFFASLLSYPMGEYIKTPLQLVSRILIGIATLFICRSISYDYVQLKKREELSKSLDRQKEYYEALAQKVDEARRSRHDFKHHISAMKAFIKNSDYEGLSDYCDELSKSGISESFIPFSGNDAADGVIYHYVLLCKDEQIKFDINGMLNKLDIEDIDLCVLLGNALENALYACRKCEREKYINLSFSRSDGVLTVSVRNSFDGVVIKKGDNILSRKRENQAGVGIESMMGICKKYGGDIRIQYDDMEFSVMMLLNL